MGQDEQGAEESLVKTFFSSLFILLHRCRGRRQTRQCHQGEKRVVRIGVVKVGVVAQCMLYNKDVFVLLLFFFSLKVYYDV